MYGTLNTRNYFCAVGNLPFETSLSFGADLLSIVLPRVSTPRQSPHRAGLGCRVSRHRLLGGGWCGTGISKSQVSRLVGEIDERVQAFLHRPLEGEWPYLWLDATYCCATNKLRVARQSG